MSSTEKPQLKLCSTCKEDKPRNRFASKRDRQCKQCKLDKAKKGRKLPKRFTAHSCKEQTPEKSFSSYSIDIVKPVTKRPLKGASRSEETDTDVAIYGKETVLSPRPLTGKGEKKKKKEIDYTIAKEINYTIAKEIDYTIAKEETSLTIPLPSEEGTKGRVYDTKSDIDRTDSSTRGSLRASLGAFQGVVVQKKDIEPILENSLGENTPPGKLNLGENTLIKSSLEENNKQNTKPYTIKELEYELKNDFKLFLKIVWRHIGLPSPTKLQFNIADFLQYGPQKICIEAFRGVGKSFITSAYVLWELYKDPQKKILVVSASKVRADNFTTFTMDLIKTLPILKSLTPRENQRQSKVMFDVRAATPDQSPSVMSLGITSQLSGTRADIIVADDVEVPNNSATSDMREKLLIRTKEFSAIIKPLKRSRIIYLGTPQVEDSLYTKLPETFTIRIWPAERPKDSDLSKYGEHLSKYIIDLKIDVGTTTDPERFSDFDLGERRAEYGKAGYALQFMLNTQLSDMEKYPLKIRDLIIVDTQMLSAPMSISWMPDKERQWNELPNLAMSGDRFYMPHSSSKEVSEYTGSVLAIDPSGRGKDETGYSVVKMLNGFLWVRRNGGFPGGYDTPTLLKLANIAKDEQVNAVIIEQNFGDGMYDSLFRPVLSSVYPCTIEEGPRQSMQKERRIIDTLEPVMARHKLIIDQRVISDDFKTAQAYDGQDNKFTKTLVYQMTRLTADRGALKHDDRLDALSIAVGYWVEQISQDARRGIQSKREDLLQVELDKFMQGATTNVIVRGDQTSGTRRTGNWIN